MRPAEKRYKIKIKIRLAEKNHELKTELEKKWKKYHNTPTQQPTHTHNTENNTLTYLDKPSGLAITVDLNNPNNKHIYQLLEQIDYLKDLAQNEKKPQYSKEAVIENIQNATLRSQIEQTLQTIKSLRKEVTKDYNYIIQYKYTNKHYRKTAKKWKKEFLQDINDIQQQATNKLKTLNI